MLANDNLDAERGRATKDTPSPYCKCLLYMFAGKHSTQTRHPTRYIAS